MNPKYQVMAAATAWHLNVWYNANRFCGRCGTPTVHDKNERMMRCPKCNNMIFPKVAPAVIVGVINGDKILLTKYANREYKRYALIAGFNEIGETIEGTVRREVMEEAGLKIKNIRYYKSQPWGFDSNLLMGFFCEVDGSDNIRLDENELSEAEWVARDDIPEYGENLSLTHEMMQVFKTALL
jgi:NAD+ diphosphatase